MPCYQGLPVPAVINCARSAPASLGQEPLRAASSRSPGSQAATPAGPAQLHNPPSPDTGESLEGKRLTQPPALSPQSSSAAPASPGGARSWNSLAREPRPARPATTAPPAARSRVGLSAPRPLGPGLQLPSGPTAGPMAGAGPCGARRLRGGLSKQPRDWLRGRAVARGLWEAEWRSERLLEEGGGGRERKWRWDGSGPCSNSSADNSPTEAAAQEATAAHRGHVAGSGTSSSGGDSQGGLGPGPAGGARGGEGSCGAATPPPPPPGFLFTESWVAGSDGGGAPCLSSLTSRPRSPARGSGARPWAVGSGRGGGGPRLKHPPGAEGKWGLGRLPRPGACRGWRRQGSGSGWWKSFYLTHPVSEEVGQRNGLKNSFSSFSLYSEFFLSDGWFTSLPRRGQVYWFQAEIFCCLSSASGRRWGLPPPWGFGGRGFRGVGSNIPFPGRWRWGWGGEKLRELPGAGGPLLPATS